MPEIGHFLPPDHCPGDGYAFSHGKMASEEEEDEEDHGVILQDPSILSAAVSQASLAPSDEVTSDLGFSEAGGGYSSQSSATPSLANSRPGSSTALFTPDVTVTDVLGKEVSSEHREGVSRERNSRLLEVPDLLSDQEDDEYFEEFHLPNTYENAFVRHQSFRRKLKSTPIIAPDAERIEGLVRTGEFKRHGSLRKKILPEEDEFEESSPAPLELNYDSSDTVGSLEGEFEAIETLFMEESCGDLKENSITPRRGLSSHLASTSTPRNLYVPEDNSAILFEDSSSIEQTTIEKIQECLDVTKHKDLYNLSGRLQDILTPKEIEEILSNSERYSEYISSEVFEALSVSLHEQSSSATHSNGDSGISSPQEGSRSNEEDDGEGTEDGSSSLTLERQHLTRFSRGRDNLIIEGVFVESTNENSSRKKVSAPRINLDESSADSETDISSPVEDTLPSELSLSDLSCSEQLTNEEQGGTLHLPPPLSAKKVISVSPDLSLNPNSLIGSCDDEDDDAFDVSSLHEDEDKVSPCLHQHVHIQTSAYEKVPTPPPSLIPEFTSLEETYEERHWRSVVIGSIWHRIDMKVISPYKKCFTHGGYIGKNRNAVIVCSSCYLPDRSRCDYNYVMDNIFLYALSTLEQMVVDEYELIYLTGGTPRGSVPGFQWFKKAYQLINRRLRKNLKTLYVVHPSLWVKTVIACTRPFVSSKFYRKVHFISNLTELAQIIPLDQLHIPDEVKQADFELMIQEKKRKKSHTSR